jgi:tetratricopeptide (TPR) repeat protein
MLWLAGFCAVSLRAFGVPYRLITFLSLFFTVWAITTAPSSSAFHNVTPGSTVPFITHRAKLTASQQSHPALEEGRPVERELAGGETNAFQVALAAGQYLRVVVNQRGIDIGLKLFGPDGRMLVEMDSPNATQGPEIASVIAAQSGSYRIEVVSLTKDAPPGRYEAQVEALREATEQDRKWIAAQSVYAKGQQLRGQGTAESRRQSVERYQEAILNWRTVGDRVMETHALYGIGLAHRALGQPQKALECYNQALQLQRFEKERPELANTLFIIGLIHNDLGEPRESLECYGQAISMQRAMRDDYAEVRTLFNMGVAYSLLGENRKALEYYNQTLAVWQKLKNRQREAATLHSIGKAYEDMGEFQEALDRFFQALALQQALQDRGGEAEELNSIGFISGLLGEWNKALEYYSRALPLWRALGDKRREAVTLSNIGIAHASLNENEKALENYQQALKLHREVGARRSEAVTLETIGELHAASADPRKALEYHQQSLQLRRSTEDRLGETSALYHIALAYSSLGVSEEAMEYFNQSLSLCRSLGSYRRGEARALYGIARVERDRGNLIEARLRIEAALSLIESVRADAGSQELRASYLALAHKYYEFYIDTLMRLHISHPAEGFDAEALKASEQARARSLLELLAESRVDIRQGVDAALLERERNLAQRLNAKAQRQLQLTGQRNSEAQLAEIKKEISAIEDEYNQVEAAIRKNSPRYSAITQPEPLGLKEIQQQALGDGVLLLEYALCEGRSYLWAVTNDSITSYELPGREQINKAARQVTDLLTARSLRERGETPQQQRERTLRADAQLPEAARRLSEMTLAPVADQFAFRHTRAVGQRTPGPFGPGPFIG